MVTFLAAVYIIKALMDTSGPFDVFATMRNKLPHGGLLDCYICLSFWVFLVLLLVPPNPVVDALAFAGVYVIAREVYDLVYALGSQLLERFYAQQHPSES